MDADLAHGGSGLPDGLLLYGFSRVYGTLSTVFEGSDWLGPWGLLVPCGTITGRGHYHDDVCLLSLCLYADQCGISGTILLCFGSAAQPGSPRFSIVV